MRTTLILLLLVVSGCREKRECNYVLPTGCKLVYSPSKHKYAVQVSKDEYLWTGRNKWISSMPESIDAPDMFTDSCRAKGLCHRCVIQNTPKITDFK